MLIPKWWSYVTIEPALVISFIVSTIANLGRSNLMLQKLCYKNGTGPVLGVICPTELEVQKELALVQSFRVSLEISCKVLIIIISSSWRRSRKPYFLLPMCGHILLDLLTIGATYFWQSSIWTLATGIGVLTGITGIGSLTTIGGTLYASDNTTPEQRTLRIGIYECIYACSTPLGSILSGYMTVFFGFYVISIMSIIGNIIAVFLIVTMIQESHRGVIVTEKIKRKSFSEASEDKVIENDNDPGYSVAKVEITSSKVDNEKKIKGNHIPEESGEETEKTYIDKDRTREVKEHCEHVDSEATDSVHIRHDLYKNNDNNRIDHLHFDHEGRLHAKFVNDETNSNDIHMKEKTHNTNQTGENNLVLETTMKENHANKGVNIDHSERKEIVLEDENRTRHNSENAELPVVNVFRKSFENEHDKPENTETSIVENHNPFKLCLNNFKILLKPRGNHRTTIALLMIFITMVLDAAIVGEYSLLYLYVRAKFGWNETDYGKYSAYKAWIATFGVIFAIGLLGRVFKLKDTSVGLIACVSNCLECLSYMFVTTTFQMYMVPIIDMFHIAAFVTAVSILSQEIDVLELPNVLSVSGIMATCLPLLTTPLYMMVYRHTVEVWPGAFFLLGLGLAIPAFIAFSIVKYLQSRRTSPPLGDVT